MKKRYLIPILLFFFFLTGCEVKDIMEGMNMQGNSEKGRWNHTCWDSCVWQ